MTIIDSSDAHTAIIRPSSSKWPSGNGQSGLKSWRVREKKPPRFRDGFINQLPYLT